MKILVTGAGGTIGSKLLPKLQEAGHETVAVVRDRSKYQGEAVEADLLDPESLQALPEDCEAAFYLVHSMSGTKDFEALERRCAENFARWARGTKIGQILYLGGLVNSAKLSPHLRSRLAVETILKESGIPYTVFRAGIILGKGSASMQIIHDLVFRLPVMVAPKWVKNRCQPIAISDVLYYLVQAVGNRACLNRKFDIGGPDKLNYKEMMERYAKAHGLTRLILVVPVLTPRLSSYWLFFVTRTNFSLASSLVESLKSEAICSEQEVESLLPHRCLGYEEALKSA